MTAYSVRSIDALLYDDTTWLMSPLDRPAVVTVARPAVGRIAVPLSRLPPMCLLGVQAYSKMDTSIETSTL